MAGKIIADTIQAAGDRITFNVGEITVMTANSAGLTYIPTGNVSLNIANPSTITVGNLSVTTAVTTVLPVNAGIKFPATQVSSSDANTLDDYEEGTWTPVITNGSTNVSSYYWQDGRYRKIGNLVWFEAQLSVNSVGIASGNIKITGLPFSLAVKSPGSQSKTIVHGTKYAGSSAGAISMAIEYSGPTELLPYLTSDLSTQLTYASLTSGGQWHFQGCYITAS